MSAVHLRRQTLRGSVHALPEHLLPEDVKYHGLPRTPFFPPSSSASQLLSSWSSRFRIIRSACRRRALLLFCIFCLVLTITTTVLSSRTASSRTLIYRRDDLQRIWQWEIRSGHHPSRREVPERLALRGDLENPAIPPVADPNFYSSGVGSQRHYTDVQNQAKVVSYPPRPLPGSVADMDIIFDHCDYSQKKLVRDCLSFLREGGGLDHGKRPRKHAAHSHDPRNAGAKGQYIYTLDQPQSTTSGGRSPVQTAVPPSKKRAIIRSDREGYLQDEPFLKRHDAEWEPSLNLPLPREHRNATQACDLNNPRLFHMYWTGPFTDKPYFSLLSFLYTQNTALHNPSDDNACHPKLFVWINPGSAGSMDTFTIQELHEQLRTNQWAAPFLHSRFSHIIQFKLWNTAERLDSIPELRDDWRSVSNLFNARGDKLKPQAASVNGSVIASASPKAYDRHSVTLSDIARFVLCHHFGGVYVDADTLFLRDWEEIWGWGGAFAYRWSYHNMYNTAVMRLNKRSALGTFIIRTALKNGFDFHPMSVTKYLREAHLEDLFYRVPDALFDSAWLNTEGYQRDKPPQPYFKVFDKFWEAGTAAPQALGFDGFFRGAYSYHYHNQWWQAIDPTLNRPDLGPEFEGQDATPSASTSDSQIAVTETSADLGWSAVLKRTFEEYIRGERPNMYGEWLQW